MRHRGLEPNPIDHHNVNGENVELRLWSKAVTYPNKHMLSYYIDAHGETHLVDEEARRMEQCSTMAFWVRQKEGVSGSQWYSYAIASDDDDLFLETFFPIVLLFISSLERFVKKTMFYSFCGMLFFYYYAILLFASSSFFFHHHHSTLNRSTGSV